MFNLYFLNPIIFLAFATIFPIFINHRIPLWMDVNIGKIHAKDIRKMTIEQCNYLQRKVRIYFTLAFITTLVISTIFYMFSNSNSIISIITCNTICTVLGLVISLSALKAANVLKNQLDCVENQLNK